MIKTPYKTLTSLNVNNEDKDVKSPSDYKRRKSEHFYDKLDLNV